MLQADAIMFTIHIYPALFTWMKHFLVFIQAGNIWNIFDEKWILLHLIISQQYACVV